MLLFTSIFNGRVNSVLKCLLLIATLVLANCATKPVPEVLLTAPFNDIDLAEVSKDAEHFQGATVRWGGRITKTWVEQDQLMVDVLQYPLSKSGKPISAESAGGRFVVVLAPPYDKKYFYRNRYITVFGKVDGEMVYPLVKGEQRLPKVVTESHYTWSRGYDDNRGVWPWFGVHLGRRSGLGGGIIFQY